MSIILRINCMKKQLIRKLLLLVAMFFVVLTSNAQSVGGSTSGAFTYCGSFNSGFVTLSGHVGTILSWESSINGTTWVATGNITIAQNYNGLTQTTSYRAIVQDGAFPPDTSTITTITINPLAIGGILSGGGTFCANSGTGTLTLSGHSSNVLNWLVSDNNGVSWTVINNTTTTLNYPNLTQDRLYAAVVEDIPMCPVDTSSFASFIIDSTTVEGSYLESDATLCSDVNADTINLSGRVGDVLDWEVSLDNGTTWNSLGNTTDTLSYAGLTQTTWYRTLVQSGVCNLETTTPIALTVVQPNPVDAGNDVTITQFETTLLNGVGVGNPIWSPSIGLSNPLIFNPVAKPQFTTSYILTLVDSNQCLSFDTVVITVKVPVPNAITPNGDGANDYFIVDKIDSLPNNSFEIYNKYGNLVYDSSPYMNDWDGTSSGGTDLPDGIYYYVLNFGDGREVQTGYVLIKR